MPETGIVYGDSGSGKTTACGSLAKWVYEKYGLTTRLISSEGWDTLSNEGLIESKIISAFNLSNRTHLLSDLRKLSRGWWPKVLTETNPILDENGLETGEFKTQKVRRIAEDVEAFNKVGLYFIETIDGISNLFMKYIVNKEIIEANERGELKVKSVGPQPGAGRYEEDGEILAGNSEGHYGIIQGEMYSLMIAFNGLGGNVKLVYYGAHVGSGKMGNEKTTQTINGVSRRKLSGDPCYCPLIVGEAKNALVPSWVGDCFHLEEVPMIVDLDGNTIQEKSVKAYYEAHRQGGLMEGPLYLSKSRAAISNINDLHEKFPGGFIPLGIGEKEDLSQYYRWLDSIKGGNVNKVKLWKEQIDRERLQAVK